MIHKGSSYHDTLRVQRKLHPEFLRFGGKYMPGDPYYNKGRHKKWRADVIRRAGGLCQECKRYGRVDKDGLPIVATVAHHIKH